VFECTLFTEAILAAWRSGFLVKAEGNSGREQKPIRPRGKGKGLSRVLGHIRRLLKTELAVCSVLAFCYS
jgi:hypothetical protein